MNKFRKTLLFIVLLFLSLSISEAQVPEYENKISQIDSIVAFTQEINTTNNWCDNYINIDLDGTIHYKFLGIFPSKKVKGAFFARYLVYKPNNHLISYCAGKRLFLTKAQKEAYNIVEYFVYENEKLCFYSEEMYFEKKDKSSIKVYEIKYYIENDVILKTIISGNFGKNTNSYFQTVLLMAKQNIINKNQKTITYYNNE